MNLVSIEHGERTIRAGEALGLGKTVDSKSTKSALSLSSVKSRTGGSKPGFAEEVVFPNARYH